MQAATHSRIQPAHLMNRKQRRALKSRSAKRPSGQLVASAASEPLGPLSEAAETHGRLGAALMAQGRANEAIPHFQQVIALKPDLPAAYEDFGKACLAAGQVKLAIGAARRALELDDSPHAKILFAQCVRDVRFTADDGRMRTLLLRALSEAWDRPRDLTGACISLIKLDHSVSVFIARANAAWPARLPAGDLLGAPIAALSQDRILGCLLESSPITDVGLERLLTNVRLALLTRVAEGEYADDLLDFCCAVARQCFINQYVFSMTESEVEQVERLRSALENALVTGEPCPGLWPAIVGAYVPLHDLPEAEKLLVRSWPAGVASLLAQQVKEPAEERELAARIPLLTRIDDEVSRTVRQQYEESPYPRWVKARLPGEPIVLGDRDPEQPFDVLIAGCGTGLSAVEFARQTPRARVLAVDLSRASLSYATRMARAYNLSNVAFGQADVTTLGTIARTFAYIDASGVLHHLADPWEGWRTLLSILRPGGVMQVGLYSELARTSVVAARALIAERGYRPVPEDIRRCREDVMAAEEGSLLKSVVQWNDFFATNECRDLLFHVVEHRTTLAEIKAFVLANGLEFLGFMLDAATLQRFAVRFPGQTAMNDLDRWQQFETETPDTFAAMYQFWVRKAQAHPE
jgi:SAM-dependent methyltransferase